jgi:hypothetical protein
MKKIYTQPRIETVVTTPQQMLCASGGIKAQISGYKQNTGSGFSQTFVWLAGAVCSSLLFLGTACSTNNPDQPKQQAELKPRTLIVTQQAVSKVTPASAVRRLPQATITENGDVLDALWSIGDEVFYRNLSRNEYYDEETGTKPELSGTLRADKEASIASFSGDRVWCTEDDQLALIYPVPDPEAFTFHDNPLTAEYTISVAGQDGSLATLAKDFHHIYGIASVVSVTGTTANAELAEMKSLLTVCKFSFVDEKVPGTSLPISTLKISVSDSYFAGTYPQQGTVSIAQSTPAWNVSVGPDWETTAAGGKPLTITTPTGTTPTEVYVALFPQPELSYTFTVTNSDGTYTGTAKAVLNEGEFVPATGLKLVKQP